MTEFNKEYFDLRFNTIDENNKSIIDHLTMLNGRVGKVEIEQAETRGSISTWKWIAGSGGAIGLIVLAMTLFK